jgi:hypothetical protein
MQTVRELQPASRLRRILERLRSEASDAVSGCARTALIAEAKAVCRPHPRLETLCVQLLGEEWAM